MERKRDKNGKFAKKEQTEKKELTSKEYEAKIIALSERIMYFAKRASDSDLEASSWESRYYTEKERFEVAIELGNKRGEAIEWLLSKLPFWTRNKFWKIFGTL
jgi:hypothetical protein